MWRATRFDRETARELRSTASEASRGNTIEEKTMDATATQSFDSLGTEKSGGISLPDERDELGLTPEMREDIDRRLAIAREQIRNGQYRTLDDESTREFLDRAYARSKKLLDSKLDHR